METEELKKLIETTKVKNIKFDYSEFEIEFENGISVTVGKTTEYDCAIWEIESSVEKEERRIAWEEHNKAKIEKHKQAEKYKQSVLSKLSPDQKEEVLKLLNNR